MEKMIAFGTYQMSKEKTVASVKTAIAANYDYIDTAFKYENETLVSQGVQESVNPNIRIQTKIWIDHFGNVREQFFKQLTMLKRDKIWSILLHRPTLDFALSISAWKELIKLKAEGYVEHIGVSNFDKDMIRLLFRATQVMPEINQIELSVTNFRDDRVTFCRQHKIALQAWTPLGVNALENAVVKEIAAQHNATTAQICLAYLLAQDITPIVKSENPERIKSNLLAKTIHLSSAEIAALKGQNAFANKASETYYYK